MYIIIIIIIFLNLAILLLSCFNTTVVHYIEVLTFLDNKQLNIMKKVLEECLTVTYACANASKVYNVLVP